MTVGPSMAAAVATLPSLRAHALMTCSTTERLSAALCELRVQERRLSAMLALHSSGTAGSSHQPSWSRGAVANCPRKLASRVVQSHRRLIHAS